ncbi:MAG: cbb3-type cytochrome c oxidase subunit I, partial [Verrucomicrobiae bacterium]|nr:cbb3-type cytochrome c oxidase subunit I [Verrucomicrobiae bacterium]
MSHDLNQATPEDIRERAAIDRSVRFPVLFFFTSAAAWLFVATVLGFFSGLKLSIPELWEDCPWMLYPRLFPAQMIALVYGWAMQAGLGIMVWLMARLTRNEIRHSVTLIVAGHIWNAGVALAVISVWSGLGRSMPWLDFPAYIAPLLFISYLMVTVWLIPMFRARRAGEVYVSEKFLIGAALWFPWVFATANLLVGDGGSAVMSAGINGWYISNLIFFWFAPVALAAAYYLIPKIAGRPIHSYPLAQVGFWTLAFLAGWTGFQRFIGGPLPAWIPAISGAATILILVAVIASSTNFLRTVEGRQKLWEFSPTLRFTMFGILMFACYVALAGLSSFLSFSKVLQFSHFVVGLDTMAVYGFFSMVAFGAIYYITPRITGCEWPSSTLIRNHFWFSAYGIGTVVLTMLVGGFAQAGQMNQWDQHFILSVMVGSRWVVGRTIAWALIAFANLGFFYQLTMMFAGRGRRTAGPTLIHAEPGAVSSAEEAMNLSK